MVIIGKRIHSTDISDVEMEIKEIKRKIDRLSNKIYQELLGAEAAFLYDQLSLNILKEPQQMSFLDWVIHELNLKIQIAEKNSVPNLFNFNVYVYVMTYGEYSYLKIIYPNEKLLKAFDGLEDYSLSESECSDKNNKKNQEWQELHKIYENAAVLSLNLTAMLNPDKKVTTAIVALIIIITGTVSLFAFTYVLQDSQKNIPVNYSAKISGSGVNKRVSSIPLKLCPGGVVPIIFATSIMTTPVMIASVFGKNDNIILNILNSAYWFQPEQMVYSVGVIIYIALIFGFSYFYTGITNNPADIAEKIKKAGGNISGIRPGKSTVEYIKKQTKYMTAIGAAALVLIALIPIILGGIYGLTRISFLGTSIIITVGVILDTRKVIQTEMQQGVYIEQMKKGGLFHA